MEEERNGEPISEGRTSGAQALGYLALFQVTRRQGGTNSRRDRRNGYVPNPTQPNPTPNHSQVNNTTANAPGFYTESITQR